MQILIFDITAPLGHFKVPYTTTSPLSLPVPSKTAVYGMLAAILGLDRSDYLKHFQAGSCQIAIGLKAKVQKTHIAENLINTKNVQMFARMNSAKTAPRSQIRIEFIKDASFRLYVSLNDVELFNKLKVSLENHKSAYTLSFGLSECLANFNHIGCVETKEAISNDWTELNSILPLESITTEQLDLVEVDKKYIRVHLPLEMKPDRELLKTGDFLIEANAKPIKIRNIKHHSIEQLKENIILF